jgi:RNA polymerase sigma factor (TIGR02999 family)
MDFSKASAGADHRFFCHDLNCVCRLSGQDCRPGAGWLSPHEASGVRFALTVRLKAATIQPHPSRTDVPVPADSSSPITLLLLRWREGDHTALNQLLPLVYDELRRLARHYLRRERGGHTLQSTALVHEAYLRLAGENPPQFQNRAHFFGIAARVMREILMEHARAQKAAKRGGGACRLTLDESIALPGQPDLDLLALDRALTELAALDEQQSRIVELRFFGGLTIEDTSEVMGISPATVKRDWVTARAWLYRAMTGEALA